MKEFGVSYSHPTKRSTRNFRSFESEVERERFIKTLQGQSDLYFFQTWKLEKTFDRHGEVTL